MSLHQAWIIEDLPHEWDAPERHTSVWAQPSAPDLRAEGLEAEPRGLGLVLDDRRVLRIIHGGVGKEKDTVFDVGGEDFVYKPLGALFSSTVKYRISVNIKGPTERSSARWHDEGGRAQRSLSDLID